MKWNYKSCPKCGGDVFFDWDYYDSFSQCFQCGLMRSVGKAPRKLGLTSDMHTAKDMIQTLMETNY